MKSVDATAGRSASRGENIVIIDDFALFREILAKIFELDGRYVPFTAWDFPSLALALKEARPSIALINMATKGSQLLLRAMMDINPHTRAIALGAREDDELGIVACAEAGVTGYHMRSDSLDDLIDLIDSVVTGRTACPPTVGAILLRRVSALATQPQPTGGELVLTARESQILRMLELGQSNRDIAEQLNIAVFTVKNHVHSLLTKLGVSSRAEAAAFSKAFRTGRQRRTN